MNAGRWNACVAGLAAAMLAVGCGSDTAPDGAKAPAEGPPWFEEVAEASGLFFRHDSGQAGDYWMPEIMGGGGALFDADGDGDLDAYFVQSGSLAEPQAERGANRLFLNDGAGSFTRATDAGDAEDKGYGMGVATGDYDGDGDVDLYVTNVGRNTLLENDGNGRFTDVTEASGTGDAGWGTSAAFFDADRDGDLDLFVVNYMDWSIGKERECFDEQTRLDYCSPQEYDAAVPDVLYINRGDGTFEHASDASGIGAVRGTGLGVVCADFNGDGLEDVFVANDGMPDRLWINAGGGKFADHAVFAGCAFDNDGRAKAGMGVTAADIDDDGDLDLLVGNLNRQSDSLFLNSGGMFSDRTARMGLGAVSRPFTRFGLGWVDFDNDGRLDLYQANGRVANVVTSYGPDRFTEPNLLLRGLSDGRFEEVLPRGGTRELLIATSRAAAFGDVDGDGRQDVLVVNRDGPAHLLRNVTPAERNWVAFDLVWPGHSPIGAAIRVDVAGRTLRRDARTGFSYLAASDIRVHFGLGAEQFARNVRVVWSDGHTQAIGDVAAGSVHRLERAE